MSVDQDKKNMLWRRQALAHELFYPPKVPVMSETYESDFCVLVINDLKGLFLPSPV